MVHKDNGEHRYHQQPKMARTESYRSQMVSTFSGITQKTLGREDKIQQLQKDGILINRT